MAFGPGFILRFPILVAKHDVDDGPRCGAVVPSCEMNCRKLRKLSPLAGSPFRLWTFLCDRAVTNAPYGVWNFYNLRSVLMRFRAEVI